MQRKKKMKFPFGKTIGFIVLTVAFAGYLAAASSAGQTPEVEACADCHEDVAKVFMTKPHAAANNCTDCHGDAEQHLEEGGGPTIFAFKSTDAANEKSKKCLTCHTKSNARFLASPHGKSSMDCTTCHVMHAETSQPALLQTSATKSCYACHEDVFSLFQLNERHRLMEGIMGCTTCHNPHEPAARERLAGFKHEACLNCHTDKGGPYLYEHGASRIEGCTSCHEVHGTPNRHMLTHQSTSDLCFNIL